MSRGDNVQGILGMIGPFWAKWGLGWVPQSTNFFQQLRNGQFLPNFVTKRTSVSHRVIWKDFFQKFSL